MGEPRKWTLSGAGGLYNDGKPHVIVLDDGYPMLNPGERVEVVEVVSVEKTYADLEECINMLEAQMIRIRDHDGHRHSMDPNEIASGALENLKLYRTKIGLT
jgi:hypothetical protein